MYFNSAEIQCGGVGITGCCSFYLKCKGCCLLCCPTDHSVASADKAVRDTKYQRLDTTTDANASAEVAP